MHRDDFDGFRFAAALGAVFVAGTAPSAFAGDVTVTKQGARLLVTGGSGDDSILIQPGGAAGELRISSNAMGTTVNGGAETVVGVAGKDSIVVDVGDGLNQVRVAGVLPAHKSFLGIGGAGDDYWTVDEATLPGSAQFADEGGRNYWYVMRSRVQGSLVIAGGAGDDSLFAYQDEFVGAVKTNLGGGATNGANLNACTARSTVGLVGSSGTDDLRIDGGTYAKAVVVSGGDGNDTLLALGGADFASTAKFSGGSGDDFLQTTGGAQFRKGLSVLSGAGNDNVVVTSSSLPKGGTIDLGSGDDSLLLTAVPVTGTLKVLGGSGNDSIRTDATLDVKPRAKVIFDGGPGTDTLVGSSQITLGTGAKRIRVGFEV